MTVTDDDGAKEAGGIRRRAQRVQGPNPPPPATPEPSRDDSADAVPVAHRDGGGIPTPGEMAGQVRALISFLEYERDPMIVLDPYYRILAANPAYRRQFAATDAAWQGRTCFQVSHGYEVPCDQAGEHCPMHKARRSLAPDRVLHVHHTPRGPEHVDVELRPIVNERQQVIAYVERLITVRSASARPSAEGLVGRSAPFNTALEAVRRVAPSSLSVLLLGESGTGKELFARAVHELSPRANGPFVVLDCSGLSENLFESELFGHERGAFTGASSRKVGLVETANGGTLFLDELGDVPLSMQVKLLRLIESGTYRRVGGVESRQADFRLVAATHKPLEQMVQQGSFRQDLYFRVAGFPLRLPPLRERLEDLPLLVESFLRRSASHAGAGASGSVPPPLRVETATLERLQAHHWPGNLRELRNVLERARLYAVDGALRPEDLPELGGGGSAVGATGANDLPPLPLQQPLQSPQLHPHPLRLSAPSPHGQPWHPLPPPAPPAGDAGGWFGPNPTQVGVGASAGGPARLSCVPQSVYDWLLYRRGTRAQLAQAMGISERTLYRRLKAWGIVVP